MITNEGGFLDESEFDIVPSNGRDNVHNDTLQKFSLCINLGHIPVNKVNSTVNNRRVSIFGDQSIVTQDETGMTRNIFHGFYSKFNLPPDVDPETLSLNVSGKNSVTISGFRHNVKIVKTKKYSKSSVIFPKGQSIRSSNYIQMDIPEDISNESSYSYFTIVPEQEPAPLKPSHPEATDLKKHESLTGDQQDDFSLPKSEQLDNSTVQALDGDEDSRNVQSPASRQKKASLHFRDRTNKGSSSKVPKSFSSTDAVDRKSSRFFKRSRKSKPEMLSVETQTAEPVQNPRRLQNTDVKESEKNDLVRLAHETQNLVDSSFKNKQDIMETETPIKQNIKQTSSVNKVQAQNKPNDMKTSEQNRQETEKTLQEDKYVAMFHPQVAPVNPCQDGQDFLETKSSFSKKSTEIDLQNENINLDIHPREQQHIPKCYLQGREIPQEIPLDIWVDHLKSEYRI